MARAVRRRLRSAFHFHRGTLTFLFSAVYVVIMDGSSDEAVARVPVTVTLPQEAVDQARDRAERLNIPVDEAVWDVVDLQVTPAD